MGPKYSRLIRGFIRGLNEGISSQVSRHPSAYAYEYDDLIARLTWSRFKSAKEYLEIKDAEFQRQLQRFEQTSAAATYSPHRPLEDTPYFVSTDTLEDLNILLPHHDGSIRATHVAHIGPKGSGKTTIQNQWLQLNHDALEAANVFYVRCDAPKIFEFWGKCFANPKGYDINSLPTVEEYLDFQTLYILAKNKNKGGLLAKIFSLLEANEVSFMFKEARAIDSPDRSTRLVSWYLEEHIAKNINVYERGDPNRSYLVDSLFVDKPTKRREYFRWKECADAVREWMRQNGFLTLRILDGVDNLHLNTEAGKSIFNAFIPEVRKFILRAAPKNEIRFAVMRNRTWIEVLECDAITLGSGSIIQPREIDHIPPRTRDVSSRRIAWLKNFSGATECAKVLEAAVNVMPRGAMLHHNMRTLIVGSASLSEQIRFRHHQLGGQVDIKRQATIQMKRNLFLNGRFYLSTQRQFSSMNREKGLPYINPFWFPDDHSLKSEGRDTLFLRIRLLELLHTGDLLEADLIRYLVDGFSYSQDCVLIAIDDARAFGWIDTKSESAGISHITYEISAAGRYLLVELLCDIDVLYMLALDTRLPRKFFTEGLIQVHTNHICQRSGYIGAASVTVFIFVSWLSQILRKDLSVVKMDLLNGNYTQVFMSKSATQKIVSDFARMISQADSEDWLLIQSKCDNLLSKL